MDPVLTVNRVERRGSVSPRVSVGAEQAFLPARWSVRVHGSPVPLHSVFSLWFE